MAAQRGDPWAGLELRAPDGPPGFVLVTLQGGPLHGLRRHVHTWETEAWFRHPEGTVCYRYAKLVDGTWRFAAR